jgi:hypothetical protein
MLVPEHGQFLLESICLLSIAYWYWRRCYSHPVMRTVFLVSTPFAVDIVAEILN